MHLCACVSLQGSVCRYWRDRCLASNTLTHFLSHTSMHSETRTLFTSLYVSSVPAAASVYLCLLHISTYSLRMCRPRSLLQYLLTHLASIIPTLLLHAWKLETENCRLKIHAASAASATSARPATCVYFNLPCVHIPYVVHVSLRTSPYASLLEH